MDTMQVRSSERLDVDKLHAFLESHFPELPQDRLEITQFSAGHSNLTYCLKLLILKLFCVVLRLDQLPKSA